MDIAAILGIIGIILGLAILITGSLKNVPLFPLVIGASLTIIIFNRMPVWETITQSYVPGVNSAITSFFLLVLAATFFSQMLEHTNCTQAIAYTFINRFGTKNVVPILMITGAALGICGFNGVMQCFAMYSIVCTVLKRANLPRHLAIGFVIFGSASFSPGFFPASTQVNNVIPAQFLNTPLTACAIPGLIGCAAVIICSYAYLTWAVRRAKAKGEVWTDPEGTEEVKLLTAEEIRELPSVTKAFAPMVILMICVLSGSIARLNSSLVAVCSMCIAGLLCALLNLNILKKKAFSALNMIQDVYLRTIRSCTPLMAIMGFGGIVSASTGFQNLVSLLLKSPMNPYWKCYIGVGALCGVTGSSAAGLNLTFSNLTEYFVSSGANLEWIHRLAAASSNSLDTLPNCSAIFLMLACFGLTHKEGYKHIFWITVIITTLIGCVMAGVAGIVAPC